MTAGAVNGQGDPGAMINRGMGRIKLTMTCFTVVTATLAEG